MAARASSLTSLFVSLIHYACVSLVHTAVVQTKGLHNDQAGTTLIVSSLTQACFNFDPRRAAGNTVIMFSCGGRADGGGQVTNSQLFTFNGGAGPLALAPKNGEGKCFAVRGNVLDSANCQNGAADQVCPFVSGTMSTSTEIVH